VKKSISNIVKELDFWVNNYQVEPDINNSIKMEVGIEDCLHIEFEYNRSKYVVLSTGTLRSHRHTICQLLTIADAFADRYHLKDVVIGKIYFLLVRIKVKHMEIALIKRESTGSGAQCCFTRFPPSHGHLLRA
jgi:vacuolar protein sorting-associated protein 26